jgi:YesN/AraC family two-component response regulator
MQLLFYQQKLSLPHFQRGHGVYRTRLYKYPLCKKAQQLLEQNDLSVSDISESLGYNSVTYFECVSKNTPKRRL